MTGNLPPRRAMRRPSDHLLYVALTLDVGVFPLLIFFFGTTIMQDVMGIFGATRTNERVLVSY